MARVSKEAIESILQPASIARGLPNHVYVDTASYVEEREKVVGHSWAGVAFGSELPAPGYAKPIDFMGLPLVVVRGKDNEIRVFHNVCVHRGMLLVKEEQLIKTVIRCPYHSWAYDYDGRLISTPNVGGVDQHNCEGFDGGQFGLRPVRVAVWLDVIFVNLSGAAEPFDEFIAPIVKRWDAFAGSEGLANVFGAEVGSHLELPVNCNWKLPVENYCEAYHVPWVHPGLNFYSPLEEHYNIVDGDGMSGQGTRNYTPTIFADEKLPRFASWPGDKQKHAEYLSLYPNVLLGLQIDHAFAIILLPQGPDKTLEKLQICYVGEESRDDRYRQCREGVLETWKEVFVEDIWAVEGMQKGRASPGFDGGLFTPVMDLPTHHFHSWVARKYQASEKR